MPARILRDPSARSRARRSSRGEVGQRVAVLGHDVPRQIDEVSAVVALLGHLRVAAHDLQVARLHRRREQIHLQARVVEVVLALHDLAGGLQRPGQRVAQRRVPRVSDVQRPGGVRADELHLHAAARGLGAAVRVAPDRDLSKGVVQPVLRGEHVQEPRARDLDLAHERRRAPGRP